MTPSSAAIEGRKLSPSPESGPRLWIEIDDLVDYFDSSASPTGIARVQLELLPRLLAAAPGRVRFCRVGWTPDDVRVVAPAQLSALLDGSAFLDARRARSAAYRWTSQALRTVRRKLSGIVESRLFSGAARRQFRDEVRAGDVMLNLGGSWIHRNFGASLRALREQHGIAVAILVHDILPVTHPEFVPDDHTPRFVRWLEDMQQTWDLVLTPSQASADALADHLRQVGATLPPIQPIRFGFGMEASTAPAIPAGPVETEPYVLFVSTIEARKNHILLYRIWERLMRDRGAAAVPRLVFAGRRGWKVEELFDLMRASNGLDGRVRIVSNLSDAQVARAYDDCLFTVFPSFCEGFGLPVAESLAHGKLCIASSASSIPEIGGTAVDYFDPADAEAALAQVSRALYEPDYVASREREIAESFRPPRWEETASEILVLTDSGLTAGR